MSVSAISNVTVEPLQPPVSRRQQEDIAGRQVMEALDAGDLGAAQQAYNALAAFGPNDSGPFQSPTTSQEFQALGQAIQTGNLSNAQQAAHGLGQDQLKQDLRQARQDYSNGGWPAAQHAVANLAGDYWAVYSEKLNLPKEPPSTTTDSGDASSVSLKA